MSTLRELRKQATEARKRARKECSLAHREARSVATARAAMAKAQELKKAAETCNALERAAMRMREAWQRLRPEETPARKQAKARSKERREFSRRDAVDAIARHVPQEVAELAVRRAERRGKLPPLSDPTRWRVLVDRVTETDVEEAQRTLDRKHESAARRKRRPPPRQDVVIMLDEADLYAD